MNADYIMMKVGEIIALCLVVISIADFGINVTLVLSADLQYGIIGVLWLSHLPYHYCKNLFKPRYVGKSVCNWCKVCA